MNTETARTLITVRLDDSDPSNPGWAYWVDGGESGECDLANDAEIEDVIADVMPLIGENGARIRWYDKGERADARVVYVDADGAIESEAPNRMSQ